MQKFNCKYYNKKAQTPGFATKDEKPFFLFEEEAPVSARDLFRADIHDSINEEVTRRREEANLDSKQHAGLFQVVLKERWDGMSDSDKAQWHKLATETNEKDRGKGSGRVYKCVTITIMLRPD